jgi:hypothetical protein
MLYMPVPIQVAYIKPEHEQRLVAQLERVKDECMACARTIIEKSEKSIAPTRMAQFFVLVLLGNVLGIIPGVLYKMLESPFFARVRGWIADLDGRFPAYSTCYKQHPAIMAYCKDDLERLAVGIQDAYWVGIGKAARDGFAAIVASTRKSVIINEECFIGIISPSEIFAGKPAHDRGILIPYLNARLYDLAKKITSIDEFVGELKKAVLSEDKFYFEFAGTFGFYVRAPGRNDIHLLFHEIDRYLANYNDTITTELAKAGILNMTVVSIDTTNIPVDESDETGTTGMGYHKKFFGHKLSTPCDANCLPIVGDLFPGRQGDATTFDKTFGMVQTVANKTCQEIWAVDLDAGYSSTNIVDAIEAAGAIPFVNVNSKHSKRLNDLVTNAEALKEISKKAFYKLPVADRKSWQVEVQAISAMTNGPVPLRIKKRKLTNILKKIAMHARRIGLTVQDQAMERKLRKHVMNSRRDIRMHGTPSEQKLGLTIIPLGTIEWMLVYATRGQNEGINGILKKRDSIIGDGQDTSWLHGRDMIESRCKTIFTGIKIMAFVKQKITGSVKHGMRRVYNWREQRHFLIILVVMIFCR